MQIVENYNRHWRPESIVVDMVKYLANFDQELEIYARKHGFSGDQVIANTWLQEHQRRRRSTGETKN